MHGSRYMTYTINPTDSTFYQFTPNQKSLVTPLYYAALCGFHNLVEHLMTKNSQDVDTDGGYFVRPLMAALTGETIDLLHHNSRHLVWGYREKMWKFQGCPDVNQVRSHRHQH